MTTDDAEVWRDRVLRAAGGHPTESTSARLARSERENERMRAEIGRLRTEADRAGAKAERLRGFWQICCRHRDLITAELASARQELDLLRTAADQPTEKR